MSSYTSFADFYDSLTGNVDYDDYAEYLLELLRRQAHQPGLVLDLACGTGSLTLALCSRGADVIGVDGSADMLSVAQQKAAEQGRQVLFLCQKMEALDLYGTVQTVFSVLDSLNHLTEETALREALRRVSLFLEPGGCFVFDVNTPYKHQTVLGDNTFVYDTEQVYCVWQNRYLPERAETEITLDFFARQPNGGYVRSGERFRERAYAPERLRALLDGVGLETAAIYDAGTFDPPRPESERLVFVARKPL